MRFQVVSGVLKNKSIHFRIANALLIFSFSSVTGFSQAADEKEKPADVSDPFSDEAQAAVAEEISDTGTVFLKPGQVAELAKKVNPSIVTIVQVGRDGNDRGTGSGFVISEEGLITTNLHVIGEGRDLKIEFQNGETRRAEAIHAWDRHHDLAVIKIDPKGLDLKPLPIGDSNDVAQGQIIIGFGAPRGLKFSVVSGVVSAIRELEEGFLDGEDAPDYPMLQIAMPIEQGNSGGPVVNLDGEVVGIVTLKHAQTLNLGFAVLSNDLKPILETPNPTPMDSWKTIGALDPRDWKPIMGASWTQNGGVIQVRGAGSGFGGRSVCHSERPVPKEKYELAVRVKLDNESGAAGLVFSSDGGNTHYGFYPTNGQMRLTRFEGPTVNSWTILTTFDTAAYKPGEWNRLRVALDGEKITGFVNGKQVMELEDKNGLGAGGKVGLCKFRGTEADFKNFKIGDDLMAKPVDEILMTKLSDAINSFAAAKRESDASLITDLGQNTDASLTLLEKKALELEARAAEMRDLKRQIHTARVAKNINELFKQEEIDLVEAGLQIAWIDNPELDIEHYRGQFNRLAEDAKKFIKKEKTDSKKVTALSKFLFEENGFHGSRTEYYHHANSYVNHVLDDREGLPITLSVVFIELARRLEIDRVSGVGLPGHFVVGHFPADDDEDGETKFIDVFERGEILNKKEAEQLAWEFSRQYVTDEQLGPAEPRDIVVRMIRNLIGLEINTNKNPSGAAQYLDLVIAVDPESSQERFQRSILRIQEKDRTGAEEDLDWLLENRPAGIDYQRLQMFRNRLDEIIGDVE